MFGQAIVILKFTQFCQQAYFLLLSCKSVIYFIQIFAFWKIEKPFCNDQPFFANIVSSSNYSRSSKYSRFQTVRLAGLRTRRVYLSSMGPVVTNCCCSEPVQGRQWTHFGTPRRRENLLRARRHLTRTHGTQHGG